MIRPLTCPICGKELPVEIDGNSAIFPFCSQNCKYVDLNRWMNGEYVVSEQLTNEQIFEQLSEQELPPEQEL